MLRSSVAIFLFLVAALGTVTSCSEETPDESGNRQPGPQPPLDPLCESDLECGTDKPVCDAFRGCVECIIDAQCDEGAYCRDSSCYTPVPCVVSSDCSGETPVCNQVLGECTECVTNLDCGESARCDQGRCIDVVACVNTRDCPEALVCDRNLGFCVQCSVDGDCPEKNTCVEHGCVPLCDSDRDCIGSNRLCDQSFGHCVDCVQHEDCPELYHCASGRCIVDVCLSGAASCQEGVNAIDVCNTIGSGLDAALCPSGTTCSEGSSGASCAEWICTPGSSICDDAREGLVVCSADGLGTTPGTSCVDAGGICENNGCADVQCEAGERFCDSNIVYLCSASGTSFSSVEACATTAYCDPEEPSCKPKACTPGTALCDGNRLTVCDELGAGPETTGGTDCGDTDQVCYSASCRDVICEPGTTYCKSGGIYLCENGGATERLFSSCAFNQYCDEATTMCVVRSCTPGTPACVGETTGVCNAAGSGIDTSMGTNCGALTDQACWNGACAPVVCENGTRYCTGQSVYMCINNGTLSSLQSACSTGYHCDPVDAACELNVCTPNGPACDGNRATTCNAIGSGYLTGGTTCDTDEACVSGTCLPLVCEPNSYYCSGGNPYRCGIDGTTTTLLATCTANQHCRVGFSTCQTDVCTAGMPFCNGDLISTCASDGSGPVDAGMACAMGNVCDASVCRPVICTPDLVDCVNADVQRCNAKGTAWTITSDCPTTSYCDEASAPTCLEDFCSAGMPACDGETLATCGTDGGSYVSQTTNCATSSQVCTLSACADAATDLVGTATTSSSYTNYMMANRYYVTSTRRLTQIENYLAFTGTIQLTWFVYENTNANGTGSYTKVFEKLTTSSGTDFHSSGAIDVPLAARRHYLIGVRPAATVTRYFTSVTKQFTSFGFTSGYLFLVDADALPTTATPTSTTSGRFYQRLVTAR